MSTDTTEIATDHQLIVPRPSTSWMTRGMTSAPLSTVIPSIFATWLIRMSRARPPTKPTRIGSDRKFARKPSRNTPQSANTTPPMMAWASASWMYSAPPATARPPSDEATSAAAAASGETISCRVDEMIANTIAGRIRAYRPAVAGRPAIWAYPMLRGTAMATSVMPPRASRGQLRRVTPGGSSRCCFLSVDGSEGRI